MQTDIQLKRVANRALIYEMRRAGATMREIAEKAGISKERVRQILSRNLGSTKHEWLSTLQVCALAGLPRNQVMKLYERGVITPVTTWNLGKRHYFLWSSSTPKEVNAYYQTHHLCKVCNQPLPRNRILFCSDACRQERHKYKYMTPEEKQRMLANIKRYRERKRFQMPVPAVMPIMATAVR
jgi:predicted nucleic acid-binding Zn ribbon protein